jgi:hypothetical protein
VGYNKTKAKTVYQPMRSTAISPVSHEAFRQEWEANFDVAVEKARQLEKQGFLVEEGLQRGALMESKAKQLAESLKQRGYEVELVPVARWGKEHVVFLVYKPPAKPVEPEPQPSQQKAPLTVEQLIQNFNKAFGKRQTLARFKAEGVIADKGYRNGVADISNPDDPISEEGRKAKRMSPLAEFYNNLKLQETLLQYERLNYKWVSPDSKKEFPIETSTFRKVLQTLGEGQISVYAWDKTGRVFFFNERAPSNVAVFADPDPYATPPEIKTLDEVLFTASIG